MGSLCSGPGNATENAPSKSKYVDDPESLYNKLGGEAAIQGVVDKMYEGIFGDEELADFFTKTDKERQKRMQFEFLTQLTGGPKIYKGKNMHDAHKGRGVQEKEFTIVMGHIKAALDALEVPEDLQTQVLDALNGLQADCTC